MKGAPVTIERVAPASTSVYDLKTRAARQTGYTPANIKVLVARKPVPDSKLLSDILPPAAGAAVELGVMFVGAPANPTASVPAEADAGGKAGAEAPVAQGTSGASVLAEGGFWRDLEGFMMQRVRDEAVGKEAVAVFRQAWEAR